MPSVEHNGWNLLSAEARNAEHPDTFTIPSRKARESLRPGDAAKLLFDIETRENGIVTDRGVDRMWVIITECAEGRYRGVLDSNPGTADGLELRQGTWLTFGPEHVADFDRPPDEYLVQRFGTNFREDGVT